MKYEKKEITIYKKFKCGKLDYYNDFFEINNMFGVKDDSDEGFLLFDTFEEAYEASGIEHHYCSWSNPNKCQPDDIAETLTEEEFFTLQRDAMEKEKEKRLLEIANNDAKIAESVEAKLKILKKEILTSVKAINEKQIAIYKKTIEDFTKLVSKLQSTIDYSKKELLRIEGDE